jgi:hypothetical protein
MEQLSRSEVYRHRAAEFSRMAERETHPTRRESLRQLACEWLILAAMADAHLEATDRAARLLR